MRTLRRTIKWILSIVLGMLLTLYIAPSLPFVQRWLGGIAADQLSTLFGTRVEVGRVQVSLLGRAVVDDIHIWDRQGQPMLFVTRAGAKIDYLRLIQDGSVIINSAQLYGADIHLSQARPDTATNFQFFIDALSSEGDSGKPHKLLEINTILLHHTDIWWDRQWLPYRNGTSQNDSVPTRFDANHVAINDLSLKAKFTEPAKDSIDVWLDHLSMTEQSGLAINDMTGHFHSGPNSAFTLDDFALTLPHSHIETQKLTFHPHSRQAAIALQGKITPSDAAAFLPSLKQVDDELELQCRILSDTNNVKISMLELSDQRGAISLSCDALISNLKDSIPTFDLNINNLTLSNDLQHIAYPIIPNSGSSNGTPDDGEKIHRILAAIGRTEVQGHVYYAQSTIQGQGKISSQLGDITADGSYTNGHLKAHAETQRFQAGRLLSALRATATADSTSGLGLMTIKTDVDGRLKGRDGKPEGMLRAVISEAQFRGYAFHDINLDVQRQGSNITAKIDSKDPNLLGRTELQASLNNATPLIQGIIDLQKVDLQTTHLLNSPKLYSLSTTIGIDLSGNTLDNMAGDISIPHVIITDQEGTYTLTNMQLVSKPDSAERHFEFTSPYVKLRADGEFDIQHLDRFFQRLAHSWLPNIVPMPQGREGNTQAKITAQLIDPWPIQRIAGTEVQLPNGPLKVAATMDSETEMLIATAETPSLVYGNEELHNVYMRLEHNQQSMQTNMTMQRIMKNTPINIRAGVFTSGDQFTAHANWSNNKETQLIDGEIALRGIIERNAEGGLALNANILPTELHINDTLWNVHPSQIYFFNKELFVDNFQLSMAGGERSLTIHGTGSRDEDDTLTVDLKDIELAYIFELARVKPIALAGLATGRITASHVFRSPVASGRVIVPRFLFNEAHMGLLNCYLSWNHTPGDLFLQGHIDDFAEHASLDVNGKLHLLKDSVQHLNLNIDCQRANIAFLHRYVGNIMHDVQGRANGRVHIYGPFKYVDLEGDVVCEEAALTIPSLNVRYHVLGDTIVMRPGSIKLHNVIGYDKDGGPGIAGHKAIINGGITYEHFRNMHYNFDIQADNVLAYDERDFGSMPFYATCYGSGNVNINGGPGFVNIDIDATPQAGTTLTYNAAGPETITHAGFVSYVNRSELARLEAEGQTIEEPKPTSDMHLNFNINLTPESQLRILMDPRTDDYITLYGNSRLRCTYYNKGRFQMYGTYRVDHGTYKLTLQDVIHKDFNFRSGGTIVFGGSPFQADLGLQAVHTVHSVSLNDLSVRNTFSNSTVRVNCIMNLGGKAGAPRVTFDFDIPNVNEEEARMVRSLISTEEERNMQVIYLLGIGRFYTYDYTGQQAQSSTAVNSLLSSTLSGQLNKVLGNMLGNNSNWNFGANLSTGNMGWSDMDVEGMLSGRLLNNRLLINGSFGYRDNPVAASNFVGDFDIQYLLNKSGNFILKAYSETNDRYFTKSALTTQGVGILLKKDFSQWRDLFRIGRKKKKEGEALKSEKVEPDKQ